MSKFQFLGTHIGFISVPKRKCFSLWLTIPNPTKTSKRHYTLGWSFSTHQQPLEFTHGCLVQDECFCALRVLYICSEHFRTPWYTEQGKYGKHKTVAKYKGWRETYICTDWTTNDGVSECPMTRPGGHKRGAGAGLKQQHMQIAPFSRTTYQLQLTHLQPHKITTIICVSRQSAARLGKMGHRNAKNADTTLTNAPRRLSILVSRLAGI